MSELVQKRPVRLNSSVLAIIGADPTDAVLQGLEPYFSFKQVSPPTRFRPMGAAQALIGDALRPHEYWSELPGTTSPLTLSLSDISRVTHLGTTARSTPGIGPGLTAVVEAPRYVFLTGEDLGYTIKGERADLVADVRPVDHARRCLRELLDRTRMSPAELGPLIGARRRTVYHWLAGGPIGTRAALRILELHTRLGPLADSRDPLLVRVFLLAGDPRPADLAAAERWDELERLVAKELRPLEAAPDGTRTTSSPDELSQPREVQKAALLAFAASPARTLPPSVGWHPRELTGIEPDDEADDQSGN
ncbi:hypothetical protein BH18ACT13_BH18ACT13_17360 [soil metagenome]